jgi:uncharacterized repeat protein (TIGR03803 family)
MDAAGTVYGTTSGNTYRTYGTVFKLNPTTGKETVLFDFTGEADGGSPWADLILDAAGNLYGTTRLGGTYDNGVVFEMDTTGHETVLYSFTGGADGGVPLSRLVPYGGDFYGTTAFGGDLSCDSGSGCGVVFKLDTTGKETVLYTFTGGADGAAPQAGLIRDASGNFYGTTLYGGDPKCNCGVVFKLSPTGKETVLYTFTGGTDGGFACGSVIRNAAGNLYGTANGGGDLKCNSPYGCGVVFKITP